MPCIESHAPAFIGGFMKKQFNYTAQVMQHPEQLCQSVNRIL